jgi:DNA-binding MarR family transcriptional regulator
MSATGTDNWDNAERLWHALMRLIIGVHTELRPLMAQYGLTGPQWAHLQVLARAGPEGLRLSEISKRLRVTEGNITGIIDRLEESGLAERVPHPEDRRVILACLTPAGKDLCSQVGPIFAGRLKDLFSGLSNSEMEALAQALEQLALQVEAAGTGCPGPEAEPAETPK